MSDTPSPPPQQFTRYLYDKTKVQQKLEYTVINQNIPESLFWVYELYFTGFIEDVIQIAYALYDKYYKIRYPKLKSFLLKKTRELRDQIAADSPEMPIDHTLIGTIFHNMITRIPVLDKSEPMNEWKGRSIYMNLSQDKIVSYMTVTPQTLGIPAYAFLRTVCKYSCRTPTAMPCETMITNVFREYWEYLANETPYWREVFETWGVVSFDSKTKRIVFDTEEHEEGFYQLYGYEIDEQPVEVLQYCLGV